MKRLYIALVLLTAVVAACIFTQRYQHHQTQRMLHTLDRIEQLYRSGNTAEAIAEAEAFADDYLRISDRISCYIAHSELRESRETAALLPTLLREHGEEELYMEMARLRAQLMHLQQVDDPILQNIL